MQNTAVMAWGGDNRTNGSAGRALRLSIVLPAPTEVPLAGALDDLLRLESSLAAVGVAEIEVIFLDFDPEERAAPPVHVGPVQILHVQRGESAASLYRRAAAIARGDWLCVGSFALARRLSAVLALFEELQRARELVACAVARVAEADATHASEAHGARRSPGTPGTELVACAGPRAVLLTVLERLDRDLSASSLQRALQAQGFAAHWFDLLPRGAQGVPEQKATPHPLRRRSLPKEGPALPSFPSGRGGAFGLLRYVVVLLTLTLSVPAISMLMFRNVVAPWLQHLAAWVLASSVGASAALFFLAYLEAPLRVSERLLSWQQTLLAPSPVEMFRAGILASGAGAALELFSLIWLSFGTLAHHHLLVFGLSVASTVLGVECMGLAFLLQGPTGPPPPTSSIESAALHWQPPQAQAR